MTMKGYAAIFSWVCNYCNLFLRVHCLQFVFRGTQHVHCFIFSGAVVHLGLSTRRGIYFVYLLSCQRLPECCPRFVCRDTESCAVQRARTAQQFSPCVAMHAAHVGANEVEECSYKVRVSTSVLGRTSSKQGKLQLCKDVGLFKTHGVLYTSTYDVDNLYRPRRSTS